jgi:hypothetical protein
MIKIASACKPVSKMPGIFYPGLFNLTGVRDKFYKIMQPFKIIPVAEAFQACLPVLPC